MNEDTLSLLHSNNIDMIILPLTRPPSFNHLIEACMTLTRIVSLNCLKKGTYILFYILHIPLSKRSFTPMNITKAWRESRLLETDIEGIVNGFDERIGEVKESRVKYANRIIVCRRFTLPRIQYSM